MFICISMRSAVCATLLFSSAFAFAGEAEDLKDASKLYQQNRFDAALVKVNGVLAQTPKDAQGRFLKGLIFTEQKKIADAIQLFTGLTEDFPELPEPYNNLAVLYAGQGNYDKAKAALELAIHTHPTYGTAYENLGDIYAQLARRSYDKALQLDKTNATAQSKLAMVKELFQPPRATLVAAATPAASAKPDLAKTPTAAAKPVTTTSPATPVVANEGADAQISAAIQSWATAWSGKDVLGYLSFYSTDFETPDKLTRAEWEAQRKVRIEAPASINVNVKIQKITVDGNEATVVFQQKYKSDKLASNNLKTVKLIKSADRWMIRSERGG